VQHDWVEPRDQAGGRAAGVELGELEAALDQAARRPVDVGEQTATTL
jgi:hypothetical protein